MRYKVILPKSVQKELDRLPDDVARRILARLSELESNPPGRCEEAQRQGCMADSRWRLPGNL